MVLEKRRWVDGWELVSKMVGLRWVARLRLVERAVCRCMVLPSAGYTMALSLCCRVCYLFHRASSYGLRRTKQEDLDTKRAESASTSLSSPYRVPRTLSLQWRRQGEGWRNNLTPRLVLWRRTRVVPNFLLPKWFVRS